MDEHDFTRRTVLGGSCGTLALWLLSGAAGAAPQDRFGPARPFDGAWLVAQAQRRARAPWQPRRALHPVPDFDAHVRLSYGAAEALPGGLRLFPAQRDTAPDAVTIHVVKDGVARTVIDTHGLFGGGEIADTAGFRALNPDGGSDWLAFLGASYFRASGPRGQYGLSARALAIDTALPGPEEFPAFTDLWIEPMGPDRLMIHALADSPSLSGAFTFDTRRDSRATIQDVTAALFPRRDIRRLGIAPITSMFDHAHGSAGDWRPAVHDSDGLAVLGQSGERIWRPLDNPPGPVVHLFRADHLRGFGLIQRDQDFADYRDDQAWFDRRPSLWVEPVGDWGTGAVMLYEMNTVTENVDNIAAMWVSDQPARAGTRRDAAYRLRWSNTDPSADNNARCMAVYTGPGGVPGAAPIAGATRYVFDFRGEFGSGTIEAVTDLPAGAVLLNRALRLGGQSDTVRVTLDVRTQDLAPSEFRLFLRRGGDAVSETVIKTVRP